MGGTVDSSLVRLTLDQAIQVWALAGGYCMVFLGKTLLSQRVICMQVYKRVLGNFTPGGNPVMD